MSSLIIQYVQELGLAARKLAVLGAALKLRTTSGSDPAVSRAIEEGRDLVLRGLSSRLSEMDVDPLLTMIEMTLAESSELFRSPDRAASWNVSDTDLLQALGRASANGFDRILALAEERPLLSDCLSGRFLDVGTGVGGIALRAAQTCPDLQIDAIDIWEPALRLAREAVSSSGFEQRISLARLDVTALPAGGHYSLVWLPTMFMKRGVLLEAIDHIAAASRPGAWIVAGLYTPAEDPFAAVMTTLRTLRGGGQVLDASEVVRMLGMHGYVDLEIDIAPVATFVLGRLP